MSNFLYKRRKEIFYERPDLQANTKQYVPCAGLGDKVQISSTLVRVRKNPELVAFMESLHAVTAVSVASVKTESVTQAVNAWNKQSKKSMKNRR